MTAGGATRSIKTAVSNPWGKSRIASFVTTLYVLWSTIPVAIAVLFSFNSGRSRSTWQGFSTRWYVGDPAAAESVLYDQSLRFALAQSVRLAVLTMLVATPIGVALAIGLARWRGRGVKASNLLMLIPLVTPEIVMGVALFLVFDKVYDFVPFGTWTQSLGHVTFSISFVVIIVRGRLFAIGRDYEEAAMDLGASQFQAMRTRPVAPTRSGTAGQFRHRLRHLHRRLRHQPIPVGRCRHRHHSGPALLRCPGRPTPIPQCTWPRCSW